MKIIVGLGNPGKEYEKTYHNAGFMAIDKLCVKLGGKFSLKSKLFSMVSQVAYKGEKVVLVKPQTFMNLSGQAVNAVLNFYKCEEKDLLVLYDDLDIEIGSLRYREKGSAGSHNGMKNIIAQMGRSDFSRARIGIKKDNDLIPTIDYVLSKISNERLNELEKAIDNCVDLCIDFIGNLSNEKIMCKYNGK